MNGSEVVAGSEAAGLDVFEGRTDREGRVAVAVGVSDREHPAETVVLLVFAWQIERTDREGSGFHGPWGEDRR